MDALIEILSLDLFEPSEVAKQKCVILRIYNKMPKNEKILIFLEKLELKQKNGGCYNAICPTYAIKP